MALPAGTRLGPFEIVALLGAGGMGEVYRARDTRLGRQVAVKLLPPEFASDPRRVELLRQEARAASTLNHPNILTVHDIGIHEGAPFIVTEFLEGRTLRERLQSAPMRPREVLGIAAQIAEGLAAAHGKAIVHRDIKPENVFLAESGHAKILDFGLAKVLAGSQPEPRDPAATSLGSTGLGGIQGTVPYMSPEQARGESLDHRSDIFSLGVVLYEMATGRRAFARDTAADSLAAILREELPQPATLQPDLPPALSRTIMHCLEKKPEERFQSARDLAFELRAILAESGEQPSVPTARPARSAGRLRLIGALSAAVLLLAAGALLWQGQRGEHPSASLAPQRIAVAVFENHTGDATLDPLGRMASDWIIQGLSRVEGCEIVSSLSILLAQPGEGSSRSVSRDPLQALARETGAGTIVSGDYLLAGDSLRFQARVTDATHDRLLYALEPVAAPRSSPLDAIDALRQQVMGALAVRGLPAHLVVPQTPPRYDAYREFIAGFELLFTDDTAALGHFARATELDPGFLTPLYYEAYLRNEAGDLARVQEILRTLGEKRQVLPPFARHWLDVMTAYSEHRFPEALQHLRAALNVAPKDPLTVLWIGYMARASNRPREAIAALRDLDVRAWPDHPMGSTRALNLCSSLHMLGQYEREQHEARAACKQYPGHLELRSADARALAALGRIGEVRSIIDACAAEQPVAGTAGEVMLEAAAELRAHGHREEAVSLAARAVEWFRGRLASEPGSDPWVAGLIDALRWAERWDEAYFLCRDACTRSPENARLYGILGGLAARRGQTEEAERIAAELRQAGSPLLFGVHTYRCACIAALLGRKDEATELVRQAFSEGTPYGVTHHREIDLEPLWDYPPFRKLLEPEG
jgi:tetratricopeptide (TPR) repeat protein